jgi:tetratricopeptide (TPR) repeat protein
MTSGQGGEGQQKSLGTGTLLVGEIGPSGLRGGLLKIVQLTAPAGILQVAGPHSGALFIRGGVIKAASSPEHRLADMAALSHVLSATAGKYRFSTDLPPVPIPENLNVDLGALLSWHTGGINQQPSLNDALSAIVNNAAMGPDFSADARRQMLGRPDSPVFADATRGPGPSPDATRSVTPPAGQNPAPVAGGGMSQPAAPDLPGADPFGLQAALANYEEKRREDLEKMNVVPGAWLDAVYDPDAKTALHISAIKQIPIPTVEAPDRSHSVDEEAAERAAETRKKVVKTAGISVSVLVGLGIMAVAVSTTAKYLQENNSDSQYKAGMQAVHDGYNDIAKKHFDKVLQLSPGNVDALLGRAVANTRAKDYTAALVDYNQVLVFQPKNLDALYGRAATFLGLKDYAHAMDAAQAALAVEPKHAPSMVAQAQAQLGLGEYDRAIVTATSIIELKPADGLGAVYATRGEALFKAGKLAEAKNDLKQAVKIDEKDGKSYANLARAEFDLGDYKAAAEDAKAAIFADATNADLFMLRGRSYERLGQMDKAAEDFDKAVGFKPSTETYFARGKANLALKKYSRAAADLEEVVKDPKAPPESKEQLAMVKEKIKSMPVQMDMEGLIGKDEPVQKLTYEQMLQYGQRLLDAEESAKAVQVLEQAAAANQKDITGRRLLARAYAASGRAAEAIKQLKQVETVQPLEAQDRYAYAEALTHLDQRKQAVDLLRTILDQNPDYHAARVLLIKTQLSMNDKASAIEMSKAGVLRAKQAKDLEKFQNLLKLSETWQSDSTPAAQH